MKKRLFGGYKQSQDNTNEDEEGTLEHHVDELVVGPYALVEDY